MLRWKFFYGSTGCSKCESMHEFIHKVEGLQIYDTTTNRGLEQATECGITSIPCLILVDDTQDFPYEREEEWIT
jgi:hypothetical protein